MGKNKRHNVKARTVHNIDIDNSSTKEIAIDFNHKKDGFDNCNALVLPSKKRKTVIKDKKKQVKRLLSKKKRKLLEKVVEKKNKKKARAELVEGLSEINVSQEELKQYVSLSTLQTKGLKRYLQESEQELTGKKVKFVKEPEKQVIPNALKGMTITKDSSSEDSVEESDESEDEKSKDEIAQVLKGVLGVQQDKIETFLNKKTCQSKEQIKKPELEKKPKQEKKPALYVSLDRKPEVQEARLKLPILGEEQRIIEAITENPVVIITGETGSGKTTQVPQFLYERGYAQSKMIGITEPRRVAAFSMSERVAKEMNLTSKEVSYLIRFEGNVTPETKVKFMTDGVLLKEVQSDFLLKNYSVIILDEAHERSIYTDILIGLLTRIVTLREKKGDPLKLIIMSATLRVDDFTENTRLFRVKPPVINVESRQFPVTIHFNKRTEVDYIKESIKKSIKIHTRLPDGGILIFLTGQREVNTVVKKLRQMFPYRKKKWEKKVEKLEKIESDEESQNSEDEFFSKGKKKTKRKDLIKQIELPSIDLDSYSAVPPDDTQDDLIDVETDEDLDEDENFGLDDATKLQPLWVLPLYSLLSSEKQAKVFQPPPEGCRLCVVSTNVAETSLTIPNIKYVVDSGRCKTRMYDKVTGVTTFVIGYTSKAGANQRAGRAGRTSTGHCFRLYSSAVFNDQFENYSEPEICRKPVDELILQMKILNIDKVVNFPFPTPPGEEQLKNAEKRLRLLGALEQPSLIPNAKDSYCSKVTNLGKTIAAFPVAPRYGKMLALSQQNNLISYTVCLVAALSVQELLMEGFGSEDNEKNRWIESRRSWAGSGNSFLLGDAMVLIRAVGAGEYASSRGKLSKFCSDNGIREKAMSEIRKLRLQLTNEILLNVPSLDVTIDPKMGPPTDLQAKLLRQIILSGMVDQVAHKLSAEEIQERDGKKKWKYAYKTLEMEEPVFMHSTCVLKRTAPEWVVYQELYETNKTYMRGITAIEPEWLPKFAPMLCNLSEPMSDPSPWYNAETGTVFCYRTGTFGKGGWELPQIEIEYPNNLEGIKWFVKFFLEGEIFPKLKKFVPSLLTSPGSVTKPWAKLLTRIELITKLLLSKGIMTKDKLIDKWNSDPKFLLSAYQKWLPESAHAEVMLMWPPL